MTWRESIVNVVVSCGFQVIRYSDKVQTKTQISRDTLRSVDYEEEVWGLHQQVHRQSSFQ